MIGARHPAGRHYRILPGLLSLWLLGACAGQTGPDLPAPQAWAAAQSGELTLIDIRTPEEWRQTGVVPGAARVDFHRGPATLERAILARVGGNRDAPIALICRTGNRTTHAQQYLQRQGFTRVYNIKEGMAGSAAGPGWLARSLPVADCGRCAGTPPIP